MFGVSTAYGDSIHFLTWPQSKQKVLNQRPVRDSAGLDREAGCWKNMSGIRILCYVTQTGEPSLCCEIISVTISPPNSTDRNLKEKITVTFTN